MVSFEMNYRKKIGIGLTGFGVFFSFLVIIFFFDKGLLAMGNGIISFGVGFFFVVIGWPILGMVLEASGFIVLFQILYSEDILGWNSGKARNLWRREKESKCWIGNGHGTFTRYRIYLHVYRDPA
ncbi:vesicle transport protein GOT1-like isoform X2 [Fagus crenata]